MNETIESVNGDTNKIADNKRQSEVGSIFRLVIIASLRSKQLVRGASPRIAPDPQKKRNTSIALEEVKRGLIPFTINNKDS